MCEKVTNGIDSSVWVWSRTKGGEKHTRMRDVRSKEIGIFLGGHGNIKAA